MPNIKDLATHLNISIGTVSRALNDRADVSKSTRELVLKAADELGYVPNQSGRSLRQGTTNSIGLVIVSGTGSSAEHDDFFLGLIDGLQIELSRNNLDLVVLPCPASEDSLAYIKRIAARRIVDGLIISDTSQIDERIPFLEKSRMPFVALGRSDSGRNYCWVDLDFDGMAHMSVDRLVGFGHTRIAVAAPTSDVNLGQVFLQGFRAALDRHGLPFDPDLVIPAKRSEQGGYTIADKFLKLNKKPTAIILISELMAQGFYKRLAVDGLVPGKDCAVIGMRDSPSTRFLTPKLTAFGLDLQDLGQELAKSLLSRMPKFQDKYPDVPQGTLWPMALVPGESDH